MIPPTITHQSASRRYLYPTRFLDTVGRLITAAVCAFRLLAKRRSVFEPKRGTFLRVQPYSSGSPHSLSRMAFSKLSGTNFCLQFFSTQWRSSAESVY